jgi:hypothetical protein
MVTVVKTAEIVAVNELPYLGSLKQMQLQWAAKFRQWAELLTIQNDPGEEATCSQMTKQAVGFMVLYLTQHTSYH